MDDRAFTLLELVVVMVLISIAMSFTIPSLRSSLYSDELKGTSRKLISLISETSQASYLSGVPYILEYDKENNLFSVKVVAGAGQDPPSTPSPLQLPDTVAVKDITTYHGGVNVDGIMSLSFTRNGYVDMTLIHLEQEDRELTVFLPPFLGANKIFDGYVDIDDEKLY